MSDKSELLYELMLRKGYPEAFTRLEDVADEMLAIRDLRDHIKNKHISEHAQASINKLYRDLNEE